MKPSTADAIRRAGLALQLALDLAEEDDTFPTHMWAQLNRVRPLAATLADVPVMPPEVRQLVDEGAATECPGCGRVRFVTALSSGPCPRCAVSQVEVRG